MSYLCSANLRGQAVVPPENGEIVACLAKTVAIMLAIWEKMFNFAT